MGNNLDAEAWYITRYRQVKARVALWPSLRRLSTTGRNLLLQTVYYGSFRYWLYCLVMPPSVVAMIESDAKLMVWGAAPRFISNEIGSAKRSRPYIAGDAKYKQVKLGGSGLMCWSDHCNAFYAHWIMRLLHPRKAQYKKVIYHWLKPF